MSNQIRNFSTDNNIDEIIEKKFMDEEKFNSIEFSAGRVDSAKMVTFSNGEKGVVIRVQDAGHPDEIIVKKLDGTFSKTIYTANSISEICLIDCDKNGIYITTSNCWYPKFIKYDLNTLESEFEIQLKDSEDYYYNPIILQTSIFNEKFYMYEQTKKQIIEIDKKTKNITSNNKLEDELTINDKLVATADGYKIVRESFTPLISNDFYSQLLSEDIISNNTKVRSFSLDKEKGIKFLRFYNLILIIDKNDNLVGYLYYGKKGLSIDSMHYDQYTRNLVVSFFDLKNQNNIIEVLSDQLILENMKKSSEVIRKNSIQKLFNDLAKISNYDISFITYFLDEYKKYNIYVSSFIYSMMKQSKSPEDIIENYKLLKLNDGEKESEYSDIVDTTSDGIVTI